MLRDDWYNLHKNDNSGDASAPSFKKKWNNWWYYNKWYVVAAVLALLMLVDFAYSIWVNRMNEPDFQIAYMGGILPQDTAEHLEKAFAEFAPDANGDGKVIVTLNQYNLYTFPDDKNHVPLDPATNMAAQTKLSVDLQTGTSLLFLMPDPAKFQRDTRILSRIDGTLPEDTPDSTVPMYLAWKDCPVLTNMDLGILSDPMIEETVLIDNQAVFENLFLGRRYVASEKDPEYALACDEFWDALLTGAKLN